eukprot:11287411-Prorocentrum_lima.AAC.1
MKQGGEPLLPEGGITAEEIDKLISETSGVTFAKKETNIPLRIARDNFLAIKHPPANPIRCEVNTAG